MLKKYKQFMIGFLVGALLFTFIPVNAAVQEYILQKSSAKITVDGAEFTDDSLPVLYYKGYNYIPAAVFRGICEKLGLGFDWVGETNEIQIQTKGDEKRVEESRPIEGATIENIEKDDYNLIVVNGIEYVSLEEVYKKYEGKYCFNPLDGEKAIRRAAIMLIDNTTDEHITAIPNQYTIKTNEKTYIVYSYFMEHVLPEIAKEGN